MTCFIMAAGVPEGTQMVFVQAENRRQAVIFAAEEIRKRHRLPKSHAVMPTVIEEGDDEAQVHRLFDALSERLSGSTDGIAR